MYGITHLMDQHRREMETLNKEQQRCQQERERKQRELDALLAEAIRLNNEVSEQDLSTVAA